MAKRQLDYDRIAPTYNQRFADARPRGTAGALLSLAQELEAERILEVGCGTAHWLADLRPVSEQLFGLDFSAGMLHQAQERDGALTLIQGRAGQLPFENATFDLVYCVNAIHHFDYQQSFVFEARRLLKVGGALAVLGFDPRQHRTKWYIYDYFEGAFATDLERFPSWGMIMDWMASAGFAHVEWRLAEWIWDDKRGHEVLDDPFLKKNAASQLALLSDQEYAIGLNKIQAALAEAKAAGETLVFPCEILVRALVGRVDS